MDDIWTPHEKIGIEHTFQYALVGSPETVCEKADRFLELTQVDELIVSLPIYDLDKRLRGVEILAGMRDQMAKHAA